MKKRKYAAILVHFYMTWMIVDFIDRTSGISMCENEDSSPEYNVNLNISLERIKQYRGNCTCTLQAVNKGVNVTLTTNITLTCDSGSLEVSHWNFSSCPGTSFTPTVPLARRDEVTLFLNVTGNKQTSIPGYIHFASDSGSISVKCGAAVFDIPPSTTPSTTTTVTTTTPTTTPRTTTPELPVAETVSAAAAITFFGFVILMLLIALCIRYREKKRRKHDAEMANLKQVIPDIEREKVDPEMLKYSWFKSLTIRLKRIYYGEERKGRSKHGRGARGRSMAKSLSEEMPTGSQSGRRFQRLFRKKSESTSSSSANRDHSPIEDDDNDKDNNNDNDNKNDKEEVFSEVPAQYGGGVFMDVRRTSCETLETTSKEDTDPVVTVHSEPDSPRDEEGVLNESGRSAEEELVSSLFGGLQENENTELPQTSSLVDEEERKDDVQYADVESDSEDHNIGALQRDGYESNDIGSHDSLRNFYKPEGSDIEDIKEDGDHVNTDVAGVHELPVEQEQPIGESYSPVVTENYQSEINSHIEDLAEGNKVSNSTAAENINDLYSTVEKYKKTNAMIRI